MLTLGVITGLLAAFFQSFSYLGTRHFVQTRNGGTRTLLVLGHLWMGVASFALLPAFYPSTGIAWQAVIWPLCSTAAFYLLGQIAFMLALRHAQPSQATPMLTFKLLFVAILSITIKSIGIHPLQWTSLLCCIAGAFVLNFDPHERLPARTLLILLAACIFYACSDFSIGYLVASFRALPQWRAVFLSSLLCYALSGLAAIPFLPAYGTRKWIDWQDAVPFAAFWLLGMFALFASFALVGVLYGGILQSTRSIMGVFLAALLTKSGFTHIEHMKSREMFLRRLIASALMTIGVILWAVPGIK
jgi:drug/metabolite transporter (DMT)-like permease